MSEDQKQFKILKEGDPEYPDASIRPPTQVEKNNLFIWDALKRPPKEALKQIRGGRLKGMTDINPQWRYEIATEQFGPCGTGWKYEVKRLWTEPGSDGQVFAFAEVNLFYMTMPGTWSEPIPGIGGSMLVAKESSGLHSSDEAFKMCVTDALSTALKMLGVASDIYRGMWDGTKYKEKPEYINKKQHSNIIDMLSAIDRTEDAFCKYMQIDSVKVLPASRYNEAVKALEKKK